MSNLSAGERLLMEKYFGCFSQNDQVKHQIANCKKTKVLQFFPELCYVGLAERSFQSMFYYHNEWKLQ